MKFKGTIWLLFFFAGLILYYFYIDTPAVEKAEEEKALAEKILPFDKDKVQELILATPENKIRLERISKETYEEWNLLEPFKDKGDFAAVDSLLTTVKELNFSKIVEEDSKDIAPFGLDKPSLSINIKLNGGVEKSLLIGNKSQVGVSTYVKTGADKRIMLANIPLPSLNKSLFDLRDKTILDYNTSEVTEFDLKRSENTLHFVKDSENNQWTFSGPASARADDDAVENFLNSVRVARAQSFVEESPINLGKFELDKPAIVLKVKHGSKDSTTELRVGKKEGTYYFAQTDTRKTIIKINDNLFQKLDQNYLDFMNKALLDFKEDDVTQLQIRNLKEITLVQKSSEDKNWLIKQPAQSQADETTIKTLLMDLKAARVKEFVKFARDDLKLFGLDKPRKEITVFTGIEKSTTIKLGNSTSDEKQYFASRSGDGMIFVIDTEVVNKIFRSHHDLKYKKLLNFNSEDVFKIILKLPGQIFELALKDKKWSLLRPEKISNIKQFVGKDILWTLSNLEYDSIVSPSEYSDDSGLDKPQLQVTIYDSNDNELGSISIGKKAKDKSVLFAKSSGNPKIYLIKDRFLDEIPKDMEKFKK